MKSNKYQNELHTQVLEGPKELSWLKKEVKEKVKITLVNFFKTSNNRIEFVDDFDAIFLKTKTRKEFPLNGHSKNTFGPEEECWELD